MGRGKEGQVGLDLDQGQIFTNWQHLCYFLHDFIYMSCSDFVRSREGCGKGHKTEQGALNFTRREAEAPAPSSSGGGAGMGGRELSPGQGSRALCVTRTRGCVCIQPTPCLPLVCCAGWINHTPFY